LLSAALPIEIFGATGAPAPRRLSRTASRAGNGAKEPENQGFFRSPEPQIGLFVASSQPERAEERVSACLSRKTGAALCARCSGCRIPVHARLVTGNLTFGSGRAESSGENESKERYKVFHDACPSIGDRLKPNIPAHIHSTRVHGRTCSLPLAAATRAMLENCPSPE
jgi:hypothetical protein